ncbi:protein phosphatase 4 regulatory subunit 1, putative (macronuclear) [Tetrahymena thermophila SB210]|uniref:Protein phosphatase 4 regulatory subunit 1, putative n=1 Tax=Tetrahymena thermophila (strain SB210) TaxID=312017 RepID=I7M8Q0_TETTS|nr:protein phosphatase 4 regulatory subunit 1, putative [Tetrahymena thermophila SB210]EAR99442.2 protein phosphatase 4 regulatory subunit 1, putative [Tetrahymena thermophila SB210]|eukprot:XP_001019687.2 protein phosphatase 4 regulatory subunit 1, putative [Tetrahymena thermophila SB210]
MSNNNQEEGKANEAPPNLVEEIERFPEFVRRDQTDGIFIDFSQDGALQKLINLSKCPFNERLTYTKHLADLLQLIGDAANEHLKQIIDFIIADNDDIKRTLLVQLPQVIDYLKVQPQGYAQIRDILTPALFQLIGNENLDIKEDSGKILAQIGDIMNKDDRGKYILTKVLNMAHDDQVDDNRIVAIQLLTQMAHCFGTELCEQFVGLEILSLGEDPQLRVRKESVLNLPIVGKVVSQEFFQQRLLPFYIRKSQDNFWGIRKACVEIIVEISNICNNKVKEIELTELLLNCLKDQSKWVKIAAYKNLGPFIVTLENCHASEKLFDHYTKMTDNTINSLSNENEILISCAQYFPAILKVYGEKKWNQLQKTFSFLLKSNIKKVKKPIACSLHEIALILGQEKAEKDLFNVLDQILKDPNDEVKYGAISHLAQFMKVFDSQKRENFLDVFLILQKDPKKWRIRELIAKQIDELTLMFNSETVFRYIMPISFKLCNDTVAIVREEAAKKVHSILLQLLSEKAETSEIFFECVVNNIKAFSISNRFNQRQTFVLMCNQLMMYDKIFKEYFMDAFEALSKDKVVNVRISLAHAVSQHIKQNGPLKEDPKILQIVEQLSKDKSRDVRSHFVNVDDFIQNKEMNLTDLIDQLGQITKNTGARLEAVRNNSSQIQPRQPEQSLLDDEVEDPSIENNQQEVSQSETVNQANGESQHLAEQQKSSSNNQEAVEHKEEQKSEGGQQNVEEQQNQVVQEEQKSAEEQVQQKEEKGQVQTEENQQQDVSIDSNSSREEEGQLISNKENNNSSEESQSQDSQ